MPLRLEERPRTRAFWRSHFEVWELSGLTQRDYCEQHGLSLKNFGNWRAQLKREDAAGPDARWGRYPRLRPMTSLVTGMLSAKGFRVFVAADGIDALHILRGSDVDLLFTDIVMPGIDGVQLAKRARLIHPGLKVLFTTGYVQRATEREAARYGTVLFKPLRYTEIIQEVEALLGAAA